MATFNPPTSLAPSVLPPSFLSPFAQQTGIAPTQTTAPVEETPVPIPQGPPSGGTGPDDNVTAWESFLTTLKKDPSLNDFLLTFGTNLVQPLPRGQTKLGHLGNALAQANAARQKRQATGQAAALEGRKIGVDEERNRILEDYYKSQIPPKQTQADAAMIRAQAGTFGRGGKNGDAKQDNDLFKYYTDKALEQVTATLPVGTNPDPGALASAELQARMQYNRHVANDPSKLPVYLGWGKRQLNDFVTRAIATPDDDVDALRQEILTQYGPQAEESFRVEFNKRVNTPSSVPSVTPKVTPKATKPAAATPPNVTELPPVAAKPFGPAEAGKGARDIVELLGGPRATPYEKDPSSYDEGERFKLMQTGRLLLGQPTKGQVAFEGTTEMRKKVFPLNAAEEMMILKWLQKAEKLSGTK